MELNIALRGPDPQNDKAAYISSIKAKLQEVFWAGEIVNIEEVEPEDGYPG